MYKKLLVLLLVGVMALGLAACGGTPSTAPEATAVPAADSKPAAESAAPASDAPAEPAPAGDVVNLIWFMGDPGKVPNDQALVEEALNAKSAADIGITANTQYVKGENIQMRIAAGDYYDIVFTCEWYNNYMEQAGKDLFANLTDKLPAVVPALYDFIPEQIWEGTKVRGNIYAVPVYKDTAASQYWQFRKEVVVDELGIDISKYTDFVGIEEVLKATKEAYPDKYPLNLAKAGIGAIDHDFNMVFRDLAMGIRYGDADRKVTMTFEDPGFQERLRTVHSWYNAGYINPDAMQVDIAAKEWMVGTGQGFPGADAIWTSNNNFDVVITKYYGPVLSTASVQGAMNAINAGSKYIDESLKYMEYVNSNREYRDMIAYGIEGTHYEKLNGGESVQRTQAGIDNYGPWNFSQATFYNLTPQAPSVFATWAEVQAENEAAAAASDVAALGFAFDFSQFEIEISACRAVLEKYRNSLHTGTDDPDKVIPVLVKEMEAAGYRDIQNACQEQLDAFVAAKS